MELYDDRLNFLGLMPPKSLKYLNVDSKITEYPVLWAGTSAQSWAFMLSPKVTIQKRVVYDAFMMFGDVGGLLDFVYLILAAFFTVFAENFMQASVIQKIYHVDVTSMNPQSRRSVDQALTSIRSLNFTHCFSIMNACCLTYFPGCPKCVSVRRKML